jgi:hypothetical protein
MRLVALKSEVSRLSASSWKTNNKSFLAQTSTLFEQWMHVKGLYRDVK